MPTIQCDGNLQPRDGTQARARDVRALIGVEDVGSALGQALVKELKGTTGRRIICGVLGGFLRDADAPAQIQGMKRGACRPAN